MASKKPPRRSAFDQQQPEVLPFITPNAPSADQPARPESPDLGPTGRAGLRMAVKKGKKSRNWEQQHQYGRGYSVKGVRPDMSRWVANVAAELGVRVAEVAVVSLRHSMDLVDSGECRIPAFQNPRGMLWTLFPEGYETSGGKEARTVIAEIEKVNQKKARGKKGKAEDWKKKPLNWTPFDQELKERIVGYCRDRYPQGEFVTFLLERARQDYNNGLLKFNPRPRSMKSQD
jgi:hypothetical protein